MPVPIRVITVCLPQDAPVDQLAAAATATLPATTATPPAPFAHFATRRRWRTGHLLRAQHGVAAGGPLRLLDLAATAAMGQAAYLHHFRVWELVVAQTKPGQPFWHFLDRHHADPGKYSLAQARQHYLAQSRIAAMRTYNLLPTRVTDLPTSQLEAFQAGRDTYIHLGGLTAVTGHTLITLTGRHLAADTDRLSDVLSYLEEAHTYLRALKPDQQLVALTTH